MSSQDGVPLGGYPHPDLAGGYPIPGWGYPKVHLHPNLAGVTPCPDLVPITGVLLPGKDMGSVEVLWDRDGDGIPLPDVDRLKI